MNIKVEKIINTYAGATLISAKGKTYLLQTKLTIFNGQEYTVTKKVDETKKSPYNTLYIDVKPKNYHFYVFYSLFKYAGDLIDFYKISKNNVDMSTGNSMIKALNLKNFPIISDDSTTITVEMLDEFIKIADMYYELLGADMFDIFDFYSFSFIHEASDNILVGNSVHIKMSNEHVERSAFLRDPYYMSIFNIANYKSINELTNDTKKYDDTLIKRLAFLDDIMKELLENNFGYTSEKEFASLFNKKLFKTSFRDMNAKDLINLGIEYEIIKIYKGRIYLKHIISYEKIIHHKTNILLGMGARYKSKTDVSKKQIDKYTMSAYGYKHSPSQIKAIQLSTKSKYGIVAISGGAGTGKTTVTKTILAILKKKYKLYEETDILALAPTGKAGVGLGKGLGLKGNTVDSALLNGSIKKAKLIIVDEAGMVSLSLMFRLMLQTKPTTKIIFLGDKNQLPSVDFGCVFRDIEMRSKIPFTELLEIHRQSGGSKIIDIAQESIHPEHKGIYKTDYDVFVTNYKTTNEFLSTIKKIGFYDNPYDMQIIVPTNKSAKFGTIALNKSIQEERCRLQGLQRNASYENFYEGDKVIVTKKDTKRIIVDKNGNTNPNIFPGVENGDQGIVVRVRSNGIIVDIGNDKFINCIREDGSIRNLSLAYAITIHKSQGAQWKTVFFLSDGTPSSNMMLSRELIYTAITRAEKALFINMNEKDFYNGIKKSSINERITSLYE